MGQNVEKNIASIYDSLEYNYDKVRFIQGNPPLAEELNLAQDFQEILIQKSSANMPSGWLSYRSVYTSRDLQNSFYTQSPEGSKPEVALVNGWPVYVTNTRTSLRHVNKINLNDFELKSGSRVDGIFLEVWRSAVGPEDPDEGVESKPQNVSQIADLHGIEMYNEDLGWAIGEKGTILKTVDGGVSWSSREAPVSVKYKRLKFYNQNIGYAVGEKGYVIKTINGGESWISLNTPINDNLNDLSILDEKTVVAVGDNGTVIRTVDGSSFDINLSTSGITANLNGVHFYDNRIGWAVGDTGSLIITIDRGLTWQKQTITESRSQVVVTDNLTSVAFFNMDDGLIVGDYGIILKSTNGGYSWTSMSDRIWSGTSYTTLSALHPTESNNLNRIEIKREFAHNFTIGVYPPSQQYFQNIVYQISPSNYPGSLVLQWSGKLDGQNYQRVLNLNDYATADALADAVNAITSPYSLADVSQSYDDRAKVRVFLMTVHYASAAAPSDFRPSSGSIPSTGTTEITFSIEDKAWIVGDDGRVVQTNNSGSKWEELDNSYGFDLYDASFHNSNLGWISGSSGTILLYDPSGSSTDFTLQDTDLPLKTKGRIYPEGNVLAETEDYLEDTIIDPNVGVKTTERVQIQYRIRVVDGIDPFNFQESGLGAPYVLSLGPNESIREAGQYPYENMGTENGDYGMWRARCRNTYDGYTWAIPMFLVTRRNSSPFNADTNLNGSTNYTLGAIRPDGLTYEEITDDDIVDVRKKINIQSYTYLLDKNFDNLLSNRLKTKVSIRDEKGTQYGTNILLSDVSSGTDEINNLIRGELTSEVEVVEEEKELDPNGNTPLSDDDWTMGPVVNGIYMADPAYHTVLSVIDDVTTSKVISGNFEGLGTNTIKFNINEYTPAVNEKYLIRVNRMDYGRDGLTRVPNNPVGIKYVPDTEDNALFYHGIDSNDSNGSVLEYLEQRVSGYQDYVTIYPAIAVGDQEEDKSLYKNSDNYIDNSTIQRRSLIKYKGQQFKGSLTEYSYYLKTTTITTQLEIPKDLDGYGVLNVKKVENADDGTEYYLSSMYSSKPALLTSIKRTSGVYDVDYIIVNLSSSYAIPSDTVVKVTLEVSETGTTGKLPTELNLSVSNKGQTQEAYRNPFISNYNVGSKGIDGLFTSVLYRIEQFGGTSRTLVIDLTQPGSEYPGLEDGTVLGLGTFRTPEENYQSFVWYRSTEEQTQDSKYPFHAIPVAYTQDLGTSTVTIQLDDEAPLINGVVYVPILVKHYTLGSLGSSSLAYAFYKYRPYQTVEALPTTLVVEALSVPDFVYVSNLGTGGTNKIKKDPYENPIEQIPVNDTELANDNIFSNVDDLDFTNFSVDTGLVKLPVLISRKIGEDITLSKPNNIGDRLGRTFYEECSQIFRFQAEALLHPVPRKVFIPMLVRVRSDLTKPFIRGEILMLVVSKVFKARINNEVGFYTDENVEYSPGYFEEADTAIGVYRLLNSPTVRI